MLGASVLLVPFVFWKWKLGRGIGVAFSALYAIYVLTVLA